MSESAAQGTSATQSPPLPADQLEALRQELLEDVVEEKIARLDPAGKKQRPNRWQQIVGAFSLLTIVGLVSWGILALAGVVPSIGSRPSLANQNRISLVSSLRQQALIFVQRSKSGEVKLVNTATGEVVDITQGDVHATHAALSPVRDVVAYVSSTDSGSSLYLISASGTVTATVSAASFSALAKSVNWQTIKVCDWSDLYWSRDGARLCFFACSETASALFTVPAAFNTMPVLVENTVTATMEPRTAQWLDGYNIVFTSGMKEADSLMLFDSARNTQRQLYGQSK